MRSSDTTGAPTNRAIVTLLEGAEEPSVKGTNVQYNCYYYDYYYYF